MADGDVVRLYKTITNLSSAEYLDLCRRQKAGEIDIYCVKFNGNARYDVQVSYDAQSAFASESSPPKPS